MIRCKIQFQVDSLDVIKFTTEFYDKFYNWKYFHQIICHYEIYQVNIEKNN